MGNLTRLAGPLGGATNYTYDEMGRLIAESTVSGGAVAYTYNALNLKAQLTNARGQSRTYTYDAMGRITGYVTPEDTVSYTYDANGNVLTVTDSHGVITRTYDALNRVTALTDVYGKTIRYEYDEVGNLTRLTYPDNTAVTYAYDANRNLTSVTDWANRVTSYTYDENNRVIGVSKPDGSSTATTYDSKQRVTSTVERTASGAVITGFEYTYDELSRIVEEKYLANSTKLCYTYDNLNRVTKRTVKNLSDVVLSEEAYAYDAAGNITDAPDSCFSYDTNNRLTWYKGDPVSYDQDGNMLSVVLNGTTGTTFTYDSANRLISSGGHTYTYNAEDVRIRNLCAGEDTKYTYNTNCRLSKLLWKDTNGTVTKYVYGRGLIGEETGSSFTTYHFDCRGSTVAITDANGVITDTFAYDTYGGLISRTGTSSVIFLYNGRDGVVTDTNGLIYMRARYYSSDMRRFVNADIVAGAISEAVALNRFAYANGNPVSNIDPLGLMVVSPVNAYMKKIQELEKSIEEERVPKLPSEFQKDFKNTETIALMLESILMRYSPKFDNYQYNFENDIVSNDSVDESIIYSQGRKDVSKLRLGNYSMSYAGCEVIAVYNAKVLLGYQNVSLADTIQTFEEQGVFTLQNILDGGFGSNPYAISRVLDAQGIKYTVINGFDELRGTPGVYIVSVWNSYELDSMIHGVTVKVNDDGTIETYNGYLDMDSLTEDIFITGYKVNKK